MVDLGKIGIRNRGDHVAGNQYEKNDIVKNDGIAFFCLKDTSDAPTTENTEYWQVWSREAAEMRGATALEDGASGLVPKPLKGDEKKALLGDGTWGDVTIEVDDELSDTSENPVQNKVVSSEFKKVKESISDTKDSKVTFESNDTLAPTELSDMPSVLASEENHASLLSKISTVFKNMRYIIGMLGSTDISKETLGIGDSTVTGAIKGLNESLTPVDIGYEMMNGFTAEFIRIRRLGCLLYITIESLKIPEDYEYSSDTRVILKFSDEKIDTDYHIRAPLFRYSSNDTTPIFIGTVNNYLIVDNNYRANYVKGAVYTGTFILMLREY